MMDWIYTAISWILLRWHDLWSAILPGSHYFMGTNWDWILAIVFLVITVRIILFPIFVKQIRSQRAMQALQPKMKALQEKHKGDSQTLREEMMKLYQSEKVNPLMGCLPMFLQIPVFLGLFHVLRRLDPFQTVNTTLYTWTQGQWDSAKVAELFTSPIWATFFSPERDLSTAGANGVTVKIVSGSLVLIMMATTYMTSRQMILKTGWNPDPQQRMIQKLMLYGIPLSLLLSGWYFPIGVIIYWVTQNLFSLGQQYWVLHKYPPPSVEGATPLKSGAKSVPGRAASKPAPGAKPITGTKATPAARPAAGTKPAPGARPGARPTTAAKAGAKPATADASAPTKSTDGKAGETKAAETKAAETKAAETGRTSSKDGANGSTDRAGSARSATSTAAQSAESTPAADGRSAGEPDGRSAFRRKRDEAPAPVPPSGEPPAAAPRVGAKPVNRNRRKGPASKSGRKGGSKR
jgi:YidC/Oxa1 family membrane protein insertase